eukprot:gene7627-7111_t
MGHNPDPVDLLILSTTGDPEQVASPHPISPPSTFTWQPYAFGLAHAPPLSARRQRGVGKAGLNNGVMVLVSVTDRLMSVQTGKGARPVVTDARAAQVVIHLKTHLRSKPYGSALQAAVRQ